MPPFRVALALRGFRLTCVVPPLVFGGDRPEDRARPWRRPAMRIHYPTKRLLPSRNRTSPAPTTTNSGVYTSAGIRPGNESPRGALTKSLGAGSGQAQGWWNGTYVDPRHRHRGLAHTARSMDRTCSGGRHRGGRLRVFEGARASGQDDGRYPGTNSAIRAHLGRVDGSEPGRTKGCTGTKTRDYQPATSIPRTSYQGAVIPTPVGTARQPITYPAFACDGWRRRSVLHRHRWRRACHPRSIPRSACRTSGPRAGPLGPPRGKCRLCGLHVAGWHVLFRGTTGRSKRASRPVLNQRAAEHRVSR